MKHVPNASNNLDRHDWETRRDAISFHLGGQGAVSAHYQTSSEALDSRQTFSELCCDLELALDIAMAGKKVSGGIVPKRASYEMLRQQGNTLYKSGKVDEGVCTYSAHLPSFTESPKSSQ